MVEKLDKYLDLEMQRTIPDTYVEAVAKVSVLEPIVEDVKKTLNNNFIKFDEENFGLLKDAREEIVKLREEVAEVTKTNMNLNSDLGDYKRSVKLSEVCEGLTDAQRERATKLLESYDVEELEERFSMIQDIIIEGFEKKDDEKEEEEVVEEKEEDVEEVEEGKCEKGSNTKSEMGTGLKEVENEKPDEEEEVVEESTKTEEQQLIESWAKEFRKV